jgi:hypothetical protein
MLFLALVCPCHAADQTFVRGDVNGDGLISISDMQMFNHFVYGDMTVAAPPCLDAVDVNDDGGMDIFDLYSVKGSVFQLLFLSWSTVVPEPYPLAGTDPTPDVQTQNFPDGLPCNPFDLKPPAPTDDVIRIGEVLASPGDTVLIPIYITNTVPVEAFQLVVQYDPAQLSIGGKPYVAKDGAYWLNTEGTFYSSVPHPEWINSIVTPHPELGIFTVGFIGHFFDDVQYPDPEADVPPGTNTLVANIVAQVSPSAPPGTTISLVPTNGEDGGGVGPHRMHNELTSFGEARYAATFPRTVPGRVQIITPDLVDFRRGDSNADGTIDLSDAVSTLGFLYLGEGVLPCPDAGDADDSGTLDITDPIATLSFLFQSSAPAGVGVCGRDALPDDLGICSYSGCSKQ